MQVPFCLSETGLGFSWTDLALMTRHFGVATIFYKHIPERVIAEDLISPC
jgi:hypothetical protein